MSGLKSATLTPFGKSDKRSNKSPRKTYRFGFTLSDPSEDSCSVFDYGSVVKLEERKLIKKRREEKENKANGSLDPFNDDENDEDVKRLARKFEEKYGEKKGRSKSYAELGAGYDENDPFIDNTEAHDEELEEDQETPCGGYYVNCGPLELKTVDVSDQSDLEDVEKRKHKRVLPVVEEEEEEENEVDGEKEEEEVSYDEVETETGNEEIVSETKRIKLSDDKEEEADEKSPQITEGIDEPIKKKRKRLISEDIIGSGPTVMKPKKVKTVKALLEEKRVQEIHPADEPKRQTASSTSINEAIESVINAGNHDENSVSSNSSKSGTSTSEDSQDGKQSSQNLPPPLPENVSPDLMTLVENIRHTAAVTDNTRKTFCAEINSSLIKLEWKSRDFSTTNRSLLFAHLAFYLPCTKDTLMRRAKKLFILKEESQLETVICKLKATIDATMPSLEEKFEKERQRMIEEQSVNAGPSNGTVQGEMTQSPEFSGKLPKRKFPWSEEIRGYLKEIIRLKKRCYKVLKPRKNNFEEYVGHFISSKLRVLWPPGWMKTSTLLRECILSPHSGKSRHSSSQSPNKSDPSRLNASYPSVSANNSIGNVPSTEPTQSPSSVTNGTDHQNMLNKIKVEKPESFSMDCLLKRTSEITNCHEYNTTLSDLMKQDSVIMNGATSVNSSMMEDSGRSEKVLDLSSCNNSVTGTPSVIQSVSSSERTAMRASDSVSLNTSTAITYHTPSLCKKEVSYDLPLNRKQRLLQVSTQSSWLSQSAGCYDSVNKKTDCEPNWAHSTPKSSSIESKKMGKDLERRMSEETTTATDILSQIINESLKAPSTMGPVDKLGETPVNKEQELLFDVMQDLRELNHMSSKQDYKMNSYTGVSWSQPTSKPVEKKAMSSAYHKEFLKHVFHNQENSPTLTPPSPYSRHSVSTYENSPFTNDASNSVFNSTHHRPAQNISSNTGSASSKMPQVNQSCGMKPLPNTGISSGNPQRYSMDYPSNEQHLLGLPSSLPFGVHNWFPGSESQSHQ